MQVYHGFFFSTSASLLIIKSLIINITMSQTFEIKVTGSLSFPFIHSAIIFPLTKVLTCLEKQCNHSTSETYSQFQFSNINVNSNSLETNLPNTCGQRRTSTPYKYSTLLIFLQRNVRDQDPVRDCRHTALLCFQCESKSQELGELC